MPTPSTVQIRDGDQVRTIRMHRPERLNAFDGSLVRDLTQALTEAAANPEVSVVVLTGSGRAFSTGADLKALAEPGSGAIEEGDSSNASRTPVCRYDGIVADRRWIFALLGSGLFGRSGVRQLRRCGRTRGIAFAARAVEGRAIARHGRHRKAGRGDAFADRARW